MKQLLFFSITFCIATTLYAQGAAPDDSVPMNVYRHYTGTIGGHKAEMDVRYGFRGAGNFAGSSYYLADEPGLNFFMIRGPEPYAHAKTMSTHVYPEHITLNQAGDVYSTLMRTIRFDFGFSHDSLSGMMYDPDKPNPLPVRLREEHNDPLPFIFRNDSVTAAANGKNGEQLSATAIYYGVQPAAGMKKKEAAFIYSSVANFMDASKKGDDLAHICNQAYLERFNTAVKKGEKHDGSGFSSVCMLFPVYRDNGMLVFQQSGYRYDFGMKAYTDQSRYLCLDMQRSKVLEFEDVFGAGPDVLSPVLEKAFRKKFSIEPEKKLSDLFIKGPESRKVNENMPVTHNIAVVNKGIIFSYSPALLFKEDLDIANLQEMRLFLTYEELSIVLTPEFKARMGLQ